MSILEIAELCETLH
jgi:hypothetical protein